MPQAARPAACAVRDRAGDPADAGPRRPKGHEGLRQGVHGADRPIPMAIQMTVTRRLEPSITGRSSPTLEVHKMTVHDGHRATEVRRLI